MKKFEILNAKRITLERINYLKLEDMLTAIQFVFTGGFESPIFGLKSEYTLSTVEITEKISKIDQVYEKYSLVDFTFTDSSLFLR